MKPLLFDDISAATCWLDDRKENYPATSFKIIKLDRWRDVRGNYYDNGFVIATHPTGEDALCIFWRDKYNQVGELDKLHKSVDILNLYL